MIRNLSICAVLAAASCGPTFDVVRYEVSNPVVMTTQSAPVNVGAVAQASPQLAQDLTEAGFDSFLWQRGQGQIVEWYSDGQTPEDAVQIKSVSKVLVTAAATQLPEFDLDQPLDAISGCAVPPDMGGLTPRHLANMASGLEIYENRTIDVFARAGWACAILAKPQLAPAGAAFLYSTAQTHLLGLHLQDLTGQPLHQLVQNNVLSPLGITLDGWRTNQDGDTFGGSEMWLHPRDLLRFGQAVRDRHPVFTESYLRDIQTPAFENLDDLGRGYALGWWTVRVGTTPAWMADGYGGQIVLVAGSDVFVFTAPTGGFVSGATHSARITRGLALASALHAPP